MNPELLNQLFGHVYTTVAKELDGRENIIEDFKMDFSEEYTDYLEYANKISKMVLELVMSMFSVGIDLELIIESVNKLLVPVGLDNFSTLDICIIDLNAKMGTFIKLGSSVSILKHKDTSESVVCKSLPIGIVQNIKPTIIQKRINDGDMIFLASDGIVDVFGDPERYRVFINDAKIFNLQKYVDTLLDDIIASKPKHQDDMSIIAVNILKNIRK